MAQDETKVLKLIAATIEIGASADGVAEPVAYVNIGLVHDEQLVAKAEKVSDREIAGGGIQKCYDSMFETGMMQVKDAGTIETDYKNKVCWLKVTGGGETLKLKNYRVNLDAELNVSPRQKSFLKITGQKYAATIADCWVHA